MGNVRNRTIVLVATLALLAGVTVYAAAAEPSATNLPPNPSLGPAGSAAMHGDSASSDTTPLPGPGTGPIKTTPIELAAACPTILIGTDDLPQALCTEIADRAPVVYVLNPDTGAPLGRLKVAAGSLLGGVYAFLDNEDRLVMVDGNRDLLRIAHRPALLGSYEVYVDQRTSLADVVADDDTVTSVAAGYDGRVWAATAKGVVVAADTETGQVESFTAPAGEGVANSISASPAGTLVATTHATYLFGLTDAGTIEQRWRTTYDRGPARKPGQLSWGTGSSPTFFGPDTGHEYSVIVDNADPEVNAVVMHTADGSPLCTTPVLTEGGPGSENSPIGVDRTVVVASSYGYPYPAYPDDAGPSEPETAPFEGGMTRLDVRPDESGCDVVWDSPIQSSAVPKFSLSEGTIVTMAREAPKNSEATNADPFFYAVIDAATGETLTQQPVGATTGQDTLQLAGTTGPARVLWQGTISGIFRIEALSTSGEDTGDGGDPSGGDPSEGDTSTPNGGENSKPKRIVRKARVLKVIDGDSIRVKLRKGRKRYVSLIGIDAPEVRGGAQCHGRQSMRAMKRTLPRGTRVKLISDRTLPRQNSYKRQLRYVTKRKTDVNRKMIKRGHARVQRYQGKRFERYEKYANKQRQAKRNNRGLWRGCS